MPYVKVNDIEMFYSEYGQGEPLVLLHGFTGTGQAHWQHQIPAFTPKYRLIIPDLRGHGKTGRPETVRTGYYKLAIRDIADLIVALGANPAHIGGFSLGAVLALALTLDHPELVKSLILVAAAGKIMGERKKGLFAFWERVGNVETIDPTWKEELINQHGESNWAVLLQRYTRMAREYFADDGDFVGDRLGEISCPTLITQGRHDRLNPPDLAEEL
ncbi:MAG: alpha/beta fold hydrolase, partial [Anaerolineae bacterium]